jgi:hypothetical protein
MHEISLLGVSPGKLSRHSCLNAFCFVETERAAEKTKLFDVTNVQLDTQQAGVSDVFEFERKLRG